MAEPSTAPAQNGEFFDNFNPDKQGHERLEEVYHKLCTVLTELAEAAQDVDAENAQQAYMDALDAIMKEHDVTSKEVIALGNEHPLKEAFFSAYDEELFQGLLAKFVTQVTSRKDGHEWDAEPAQGECDEDHALE